MNQKIGAAVLVSGLVLLAACGGGGSTPTGAPAKATLNGYTVDSNGAARFSLSALDSSNNVLTSGSVANPSVSGLSVQGGGNVNGTATICGQIAVQGNVTSAIVLDSTGSMTLTDKDKVRNTAAKSFVARMVGSDTASVSSFDTTTAPTTGYLAINLTQDFTSDKTALNAGIDSATAARGTTNLWDAAYDSVNLLKKASGNNKIALILTDGADNASTKASTDASTYASQNGVKMYMVGLGDSTSIDFSSMQAVAGATGGLFAAAKDPAALTSLFDGMFNATKAAFCITVQFTVNGAKPTPGTSITGKLNFQVQGKDFSVDFNTLF